MEREGARLLSPCSGKGLPGELPDALQQTVFFSILHFRFEICPMRAKELRQLRLEKRLTQAEVAKKLKVSQGYYSSVERGEKRRELAEAAKVVNRMRMRTDRTEGGVKKAGRQK